MKNNIKDQTNIINAEWPEIYAIYINLKTNKELNENNLAWIKEIAKATG
jgi:hypothetical protein